MITVRICIYTSLKRIKHNFSKRFKKLFDHTVGITRGNKRIGSGINMRAKATVIEGIRS